MLCQPNQWKLLLISDPGQRNKQTNRERGRVTKSYVGPDTRPGRETFVGEERETRPLLGLTNLKCQNRK